MSGVAAFSVRLRYPIILAWVAAIALAMLFFPSLASQVDPDNSQFLSSSTPSKEAARLASPFQPASGSGGSLWGRVAEHVIRRPVILAVEALQVRDPTGGGTSVSEWKVWYQPHAKFGRRYFSGTLTVAPGLARVEGKKDTVTIDNARVVDRRIVGMNNWIHVGYDEAGEERDAYFLDRRMLGWSGILGANEKLQAELREALSPS
jgi:hypothetical protein